MNPFVEADQSGSSTPTTFLYGASCVYWGCYNGDKQTVDKKCKDCSYLYQWFSNWGVRTIDCIEVDMVIVTSRIGLWKSF